jgi:hypothetical protein
MTLHHKLILVLYLDEGLLLSPNEESKLDFSLLIDLDLLKKFEALEYPLAFLY